MSDQISENAPLTIQGVRDLIAEKHDVLLDENDPILIAVTMHRAALNEYELLLTDHQQKLSADMSGHVAAFAAEVRKSTNSLLSKAVKANIDNCLAQISEHEKQMSRFISSIRAMAIFAGVLFGLSIAVSVSVIVWGS
ncbi:hypothetical protein [Desulfovibrio sp. JC022]|uniref:hypothetical protein n=1 Tax=Desulfovibrio sp. JC022 TaxID=2593642 RepID=UPI0013D33D04|nr:hypothetical protein [Desulfovibrio sp. JC022]NDV24834.1 hypothetical protein [Desulfovibrio sp. JC022]